MDTEHVISKVIMTQLRRTHKNETDRDANFKEEEEKRMPSAYNTKLKKYTHLFTSG